MRLELSKENRYVCSKEIWDEIMEKCGIVI